MADQDDDPQRRVALWLVFGVVAAVVIGVLAFATMRTVQRGAAPQAAAAEVEVVDVVVVGEPMAVLYFDLAKSDLPGESPEVVARVAQAVKVDERVRIFLSGFHDASGDAARNAELAKQRALAVRAALRAAGVGADRVVLVRPAVTTGGGTEQEARRVEIRVLAPQ